MIDMTFTKTSLISLATAGVAEILPSLDLQHRRLAGHLLVGGRRHRHIAQPVEGLADLPSSRAIVLRRVLMTSIRINIAKFAEADLQQLAA